MLRCFADGFKPTVGGWLVCLMFGIKKEPGAKAENVREYLHSQNLHGGVACVQSMRDLFGTNIPPEISHSPVFCLF